jgi:hypothetical protein
MDLSICIVSYECREKLRACLESIRANRPSVEHEVIVVDNGSTDGAVTMLKEHFYWVRVLANPENRGFSVAMNQAVQASTGKVILMLNPDTEVVGDALGALLRFVRERPWIGAVGPKLVDPDGDPENSCREFPTLMNALWDLTGLSRAFSGSRVFGHYLMSWWDHSEPRAVDWLSGAALMFTRMAWQKVGPLDEAFFLPAADLDWQKRLQRAGLDRWYLPSAQILHHHGRSWGGDEADEIVPLHMAAFRYFAKHHGTLSALALRALTILTFGPKTLWAALRALVRPSDDARRNVRTASAVLRTALGFPPRSALDGRDFAPRADRARGDASSEPPTQATDSASE